ncbi:MAG: glycosyltransferase family 2 protein [Clostridia bacterium]|nr:glycosyltransferase family 2 protein [Clostridia bacterium]
MKITHLISTMHRDCADFISDMRLSCDATVVNQCDTEGYSEEHIGKSLVKMYSTKERGLSLSRNMLLDKTVGDIAILSDDDIVYLDGYEEKLAEAYKSYPNADIIVFSFTEKAGECTRRQFKRPRWLGRHHISKIASVEISFRVASVRSAGLRFDTLLGLGAPFGSAEENAFLSDALSAGLKILYLPMTLCYLPPDETRQKWQDGFDGDYFFKKGGCFYRIYGKSYLLYSLAFILSKKSSLFRNVKIFSALKNMRRGKKSYKELSGNASYGYNTDL